MVDYNIKGYDEMYERLFGYSPEDKGSGFFSESEMRDMASAYMRDTPWGDSFNNVGGDVDWGTADSYSPRTVAELNAAKGSVSAEKNEPIVDTKKAAKAGVLATAGSGGNVLAGLTAAAASAVGDLIGKVTKPAADKLKNFIKGIFDPLSEAEIGELQTLAEGNDAVAGLASKVLENHNIIESGGTPESTPQQDAQTVRTLMADPSIDISTKEWGNVVQALANNNPDVANLLINDPVSPGATTTASGAPAAADTTAENAKFNEVISNFLNTDYDAMAGVQYDPATFSRADVADVPESTYSPEGPTSVDSDYTPQTIGDYSVTAPAGVDFDANQFNAEIDDLKFLAEGKDYGEISDFEAREIQSLQDSIGTQWRTLWGGINQEMDAREQREIQTIVERVNEDWGGEFAKNVSSLVARGLSSPGQSTASEYMTDKMLSSRDRALVQGIRDIQNAASDRRVALAIQGLEFESDLAKFDVGTQLALGEQELAARGQDINVRGQNINIGESQADRAAQLAMYGINTRVDLEKFAVTTELQNQGMDLDAAIANANLAQRGDISSAEMAQDWAKFQSSQEFQAAETYADRMQEWNKFQENKALTTRGQDIDLARLNMQTDMAEADLQQDWTKFQIGQETDADKFKVQTALDIYNIQQSAEQAKAERALRSGIAGMEKDAADEANKWSLWGNIGGAVLPSLFDDWFGGD